VGWSERLNQLRKYARRAPLFIAALAALLYLGDYAAVRLRAAYPRLGSAYGSVQMVRLYAIPLKSGSIEYELDAREPEVTVRCVRALFPHMGYRPCWYLRRNSQKPIPMTILISDFSVIEVLRTGRLPKRGFRLPWRIPT
jgi:hypothetical protein